MWAMIEKLRIKSMASYEVLQKTPYQNTPL